jgi:hypothetical protein
MKQSVCVRMYHSKQEHTILLDFISAYYVAISKIAYGLNKVDLHIHLFNRQLQYYRAYTLFYHSRQCHQQTKLQYLLIYIWLFDLIIYRMFNSQAKLSVVVIFTSNKQYFQI